MEQLWNNTTFMAALTGLVIALAAMIRRVLATVQDVKANTQQIHVIVNSRTERLEADMRELRSQIETAKLVAVAAEIARLALAAEVAKGKETP